MHKHRNLLAHTPKRMHDELTEDYRDMIYTETATGLQARRKTFLRKWRLKCRAVADSLEEAGERLFTFASLPKSQWRTARTTNAIERLHEEFRRRIKTQTVLPAAETAPMLFRALLASGQITMRKVDGWLTLARPTATGQQPIYLAAGADSMIPSEIAARQFQPTSRQHRPPFKVQLSCTAEVTLNVSVSVAD